MNKLTDGERLAVVESELQNIKDIVNKIDGKLDNLPNYATKTELEVMKKRSALQVWITGTLSAAFGVLMTILIQSYFKG